MNEPFLGRITWFRVRVYKCERTAQEQEKKKEKQFKKWSKPGWATLYICSWTGLTHTRSIFSWSWPFDQILMDLDQSNAPGALAWSGPIRCVGLGLATVGFQFFCVFLNFCAMYTPVLAIWTSMHVNFLAKNS